MCICMYERLLVLGQRRCENSRSTRQRNTNSLYFFELYITQLLFRLGILRYVTFLFATFQHMKNAPCTRKLCKRILSLQQIFFFHLYYYILPSFNAIQTFISFISNIKYAFVLFLYK